jgi:hypothetical protein
LDCAGINEKDIRKSRTELVITTTRKENGYTERPLFPPETSKQFGSSQSHLAHAAGTHAAFRYLAKSMHASQLGYFFFLGISVRREDNLSRQGVAVPVVLAEQEED